MAAILSRSQNDMLIKRHSTAAVKHMVNNMGFDMYIGNIAFKISNWNETFW